MADSMSSSKRRRSSVVPIREAVLPAPVADADPSKSLSAAPESSAALPPAPPSGANTKKRSSAAGGSSALASSMTTAVLEMKLTKVKRALAQALQKQQESDDQAKKFKRLLEASSVETETTKALLGMYETKAKVLLTFLREEDPAFYHVADLTLEKKLTSTSEMHTKHDLLQCYEAFLDDHAANDDLVGGRVGKPKSTTRQRRDAMRPKGGRLSTTEFNARGAATVARLNEYQISAAVEQRTIDIRAELQKQSDAASGWRKTARKAVEEQNALRKELARVVLGGLQKAAVMGRVSKTGTGLAAAVKRSGADVGACSAPDVLQEAVSLRQDALGVGRAVVPAEVRRPQMPAHRAMLPTRSHYGYFSSSIAATNRSGGEEHHEEGVSGPVGAAAVQPVSPPKHGPKRSSPTKRMTSPTTRLEEAVLAGDAGLAPMLPPTTLRRGDSGEPLRHAMAQLDQSPKTRGMAFRLAVSIFLDDLAALLRHADGAFRRVEQLLLKVAQRSASVAGFTTRSNSAATAATAATAPRTVLAAGVTARRAGRDGASGASNAAQAEEAVQESSPGVGNSTPPPKGATSSSSAVVMLPAIPGAVLPVAGASLSSDPALTAAAEVAEALLTVDELLALSDIKTCDFLTAVPDGLATNPVLQTLLAEDTTWREELALLALGRQTLADFLQRRTEHLMGHVGAFLGPSLSYRDVPDSSAAKHERADIAWRRKQHEDSVARLRNNGGESLNTTAATVDDAQEHGSASVVTIKA